MRQAVNNDVHEPDEMYFNKTAVSRARTMILQRATNAIIKELQTQLPKSNKHERRLNGHSELTHCERKHNEILHVLYYFYKNKY